MIGLVRLNYNEMLVRIEESPDIVKRLDDLS